MRAARARAGAAGLAVAFVLAGCSSQATSNSSVSATGRTLSVWISEPPNLAGDPAWRDVIDAEQLAFHEQSSEVTSFHLRLVQVSRGELSANARAAIQDKSAIAYLGELAPGSSEQTVGITNALDLLQVSPTDNALELTTPTPAVPKAPDEYFETLGTYGRTFARVVPSGSAEALAQVAKMKALGLKSVYVASDGSDYGRAIAHAVSADAAPGLSLASSAATADAFFYGGESPTAAAHAFAAAAAARPAIKLFGSSSLAVPAFVSSLGAGVASRVLLSVPAAARSGAANVAAFDSGFKAAFGHAPAPEAAFGWEAMSAVLSAIKTAGSGAGNRGNVISDFFAIRNRQSILGTYSIDRGGNASLSGFVFERIQGGALVPITAVRQPGKHARG